MLGLSGVTRTPRVRSLTARELPLAVEGYLVYCIFASVIVVSFFVALIYYTQVSTAELVFLGGTSVGRCSEPLQLTFHKMGHLVSVTDPIFDTVISFCSKMISFYWGEF